jgi:RNA polymerase sigma factor (sigma-70 family)
MPSVTHSTISAVWRIEAPRLLGGLIRVTRDIDLAEDLAQDALVSALEHWPASGLPESPGAWLMTAAKHRALDAGRRTKMLAKKHALLSVEPESEVLPTDHEPNDDVLRLVMIACHPVLPKEGRVALTLRLVGGLSTQEIARAFLLPEATVAQRIVRAKRTLAEARVPFETPEGADLLARLPSVLEVLYLIFNEGYVAAAGDEWMRPELCHDAMRLGRVLAALMPGEAEAHGLVALMELQASRMRARLDKCGDPIPLQMQNRSQWDHVLIQHGLAALRRAESFQGPLGVYTLQAAIAACHAQANTFQTTDWQKIVALYDALVELTQSPVIELNRAVAVGMAYGPADALELVDRLMQQGQLEQYAMLPATRGDLLEKLGRPLEASAEFERAAAMTSNAKEKAFLLDRARRAPQRSLPS